MMILQAVLDRCRESKVQKYKFLGAALLMIGMIGTALAADNAVVPAPEIDPSSAASALTLLAGVLSIIRGRHAKK
jgi:hypothetical protein